MVLASIKPRSKTTTTVAHVEVLTVRKLVRARSASAGRLKSVIMFPPVARLDMPLTTERDVRWELLTPVPEPGAEFLEVRYPVGGGSSGTGEAIRHNGRDYCLILEGSLSVQIGFEQYVLGAGDSMAFDGTIPHRLWGAGDVAVRAVWFVLDRWLPHGPAENGWTGGTRPEVAAE